MRTATRTAKEETIISISSVQDTYVVYDESANLDKSQLLVNKVVLAALVDAYGVECVRFLDFDAHGCQDFADTIGNFVQFVFSKAPVAKLQKQYPNSKIEFNL